MAHVKLGIFVGYPEVLPRVAGSGDSRRHIRPEVDGMTASRGLLDFPREA
jgi:hypothetical protein